MTSGFLSGSNNFCKLLCVSWEVFVLHGYDWIHWVAKSCTTIENRWLFRDSQLSLKTLWSAVIKSPKFSARGTAPPLRLLHGPCDFGPLTDLAISVLREVSKKHSVYPNPHFSWVWALKMVHEKNWRVSLCVQELCHLQDSIWILAAIPVSRNDTGLPVLARDPHFYLVLGFGLVYSTTLLMFQNSTGLTVLAFPQVHLTRLRDGDPSHTGLSVLVYPHFRLTRLKMSWVLRWTNLRKTWDGQFPALKGVMGVEEGKLEEELVDKPRTTIGTKFSVLHCTRIPFLMRCGFWPLIHSYEYPCSSQSFPGDKTAGVFSRTFIVKNIPNSLTHCGLFMRLHFSIGCYDYRRTTRLRQRIHFSRIQVLFADHVHRRSRVYNKFSFLKFKIWCRQAPIFRRWEECCSFLLLQF